MLPFFSVIIPTYNRAALLPKAIQSVLSQEETNWELIIIDDGSTDNTREVVHQFKDDRIQYHYQENAERSAARNHGVKLAAGKYICFLDSDDYYLPHHLSTFKKAILESEEEKVLLFIDIIFEHEGKQIRFKNPNIQFKNQVEWMIQMPIGALRTCSHKSILLQFPFNTNYTVSEDTDVWARIAQHYSIRHIAEATLVVINHDERSVDRSNSHSFKKNIEVKKAIIKRDKKWIGSRVRNKVMHNVWFNLAQSYFENEQYFPMLSALLRSFLFKPTVRIKEKLYMALSPLYLYRVLTKHHSK